MEDSEIRNKIIIFLCVAAAAVFFLYCCSVCVSICFGYAAEMKQQSFINATYSTHNKEVEVKRFNDHTTHMHAHHARSRDSFVFLFFSLQRVQIQQKEEKK